MARHVNPRKPRVSTVTTVVVTVATLYFAQEVLIPLALSILLAFLLAPLANRLERWRFGTVPAVLISVGGACVVILLLGWVVGRQFVALTDELPRYQVEIIDKVKRVSGTGSGIGSKIEQFGDAVERATARPTTAPSATSQPSTTRTAAAAQPSPDTEVPPTVVGREVVRTTEVEPAGGSRGVLDPSKPVIGTSLNNPFYAIALPAPVSPIRTIATYLGLVLGPLGTLGLVLVFVVFILLERKGLRDRLIHLISRGKYTLTTRALNDAGSRISRYILAQAIVNGSYGVVIAVGLWVIGLTLGHGTGFPSFVLWGLIAAVLRFVPYVGPAVSSIFPLALSLAVYPGFSVFIATLALVAANELVSNNVVEPWLYGASTGLSAVALLVAAVFWTWLWGPIGLLMATPLTVCIVVLGKYVPQLKFLDVLLGDQPALPIAATFYQRLVAGNAAEAATLMRELSEARSPNGVGDALVLPALRFTRRDREDGDLSSTDEAAVMASLRTILQPAPAAGVKEAPPSNADERATEPASDTPLVLGCPAHHATEELTLMALRPAPDKRRYRVEVCSTRLLPTDIEARIDKERPSVVFIAVLPPGGLPQARYLCRRLRKRYEKLPILIGYWGKSRNFDRLLVRFRTAGASYVMTSILQSQKQLEALLPKTLTNDVVSNLPASVDGG